MFRHRPSLVTVARLRKRSHSREKSTERLFTVTPRVRFTRRMARMSFLDKITRRARAGARKNVRFSPLASPHLARCQRWASAPCRAIDGGVGGSNSGACGINRNVGWFFFFFYWRLLFEVQARGIVSPLSTHEPASSGLLHAVFTTSAIHIRRGSFRVETRTIVTTRLYYPFGGVDVFSPRLLPFSPIFFFTCKTPS